MSPVDGLPGVVPIEGTSDAMVHAMATAMSDVMGEAIAGSMGCTMGKTQ